MPPAPLADKLQSNSQPTAGSPRPRLADDTTAPCSLVTQLLYQFPRMGRSQAALSQAPRQGAPCSPESPRVADCWTNGLAGEAQSCFPMLPDCG